MFLVATAALFATAVIGQTLRLNPYFGNMDDGGFLERAGNSDPLQFAVALSGGFESGFFRTSSMLIVWPSYWLGSVWGPTGLFLANALLVFACLVAFALAIRRLLGWIGAWPSIAFLAAALIWPYTAELFFFPSLSEKGIILGAAALIWWSAESARIRSAVAYWVTFLSASAFAFTSKVHILVYVPAIVLSLWLAPRPGDSTRNLPRLIPATALLIALSLALGTVALRAPYTQSTQGILGFDFVSDRRFVTLLVFTVSYVVALLVRALLRKNRPLDWIPAALLTTMCTAFAVWDIRNYFLAIAGVMVGSAIGSVVSWMRPPWIQILIAGLLVVFAFGWLLFRLPIIYSSLASVGYFLSSPMAAQLDSERATIYVSCLEAPDHYNRYANASDLTGILFVFLGNASPSVDDPAVDDKTFVLADSRLCPWSPTEPSSSSKHNAYYMHPLQRSALSRLTLVSLLLDLS